VTPSFLEEKLSKKFESKNKNWLNNSY
jgi:hypothetical protein